MYFIKLKIIDTEDTYTYINVEDIISTVYLPSSDVTRIRTRNGDCHVKGDLSQKIVKAITSATSGNTLNIF